jgi:hypothetical protein
MFFWGIINAITGRLSADRGCHVLDTETGRCLSRAGRAEVALAIGKTWDSRFQRLYFRMT